MSPASYKACNWASPHILNHIITYFVPDNTSHKEKKREYHETALEGAYAAGNSAVVLKTFKDVIDKVERMCDQIKVHKKRSIMLIQRSESDPNKMR